MRLAVTVAVHNRLEHTKRCLHCLRAAARRAGIEVTFLVVDDGSTDGTGAWLLQQPDVIRLSGDGHLWFGRATDWALRRVADLVAGADYVMILNNDVFLHEDGLVHWLPHLAPDRVVGGCWRSLDGDLEACSVGRVWHRWRGQVEILHESRGRFSAVGPCVPVQGLATTLLIAPIAAAAATADVSLERHPHHRYDALLAEAMRRRGFSLFALTRAVADHDLTSTLGSQRSRPWSVFRRACADPLFVGYLPGRVELAWRTAPTLVDFVAVLVREGALFVSRVIRGRA